MFEASHLQHNIVSGYIQVVSDGHYLPAFWAHPDLGGSFPGLLMLHSDWGLTAHTRSQARRFAEMGYYVIAPDLFNRQTVNTPEQAQALITELGEVAYSRVTAALHALRSHHKCNGQIGIIGWRLGGRLALHTAALRDDVDALVIFYGLPDELAPAELLMLTCPVLTFLGINDPATPPDKVERLCTLLAQTGQPHHVIVFPAAGCDFFDDSRPNFEEAAAEAAWLRTLEFLAAHLEQAQPGESGPFEPGKVY